MATVEEVTKLARLARLAIPHDALESRASEFDQIVSYIAQLESLDLPTALAPQAPTHRNILRADGEPTPSGTWTEKLVSLFPKRVGEHLAVKKIISHD